MPIPKSRDNHLIAAGPLVGCLGDGGLPSGPALAPGDAAWARGPPACARVRRGQLDMRG
ncbi:MAG: hypothetical protein PHY05_04390 [Methanothrix sp.]|nr:hypothetical protein [Methanothrix sp.]